MTYDEFNEFCASLSATEMVFQWGGSYVWKVGGKVFAIGGWGENEPAFTFKTSELVFENLKDQPGLRGAPYFASRGMKWIQHYARPGLSDDELKSYITESHHLASLNLSKKKRLELGL
ncbi:MAG: MmcQ/YjbR family DNA-binding protein [Robiginitomaculum sp.]|nr:MmcQ/YjbR family DNA-binding protein [Robiginitomaculum sp.]